MNKIIKVGIIGLFSLFYGCDKSEEISQPIEEGVYFGTFTVEYLVDMREGWSSSGTTTLELKNGKYTYISDIPPKSSYGNYIISNDKIIFVSDKGIENTDLNIVSPNFDINLILDGEYDYTFNGKQGKQLKFTAIKDYVGHYEYDLKKQ